MLKSASNALKCVRFPPFAVTLPAQLVSQLRQRRRRLGLRQKDLATRIGVNKSALGRWERRKAEPSLAGVCAWAQELGFDIVLSAQRAEGELLISNQRVLGSNPSAPTKKSLLDQ